MEVCDAVLCEQPDEVEPEDGVFARGGWEDGARFRVEVNRRVGCREGGREVEREIGTGSKAAKHRTSVA